MLDFTALSSLYDQYIFELVTLLPATDGAALWLRMSTDGGASFAAGTAYYWTAFSQHEGASGNNGATGQAQIVVHYGQATASDDSLNGSIRLYDPLGARTKTVDGRTVCRYAAADAHMLQWFFTGFYRNVTAVNAIRFLNATGTIASGTIRMYGVAK